MSDCFVQNSQKGAAGATLVKTQWPSLRFQENLEWMDQFQRLGHLEQILNLIHWQFWA